MRVAFFGHAEGRRADGLSTYSSELVRALRRQGADVRFFAHREDGDVVPVDTVDAHLLSARHFKTVTISRRGTLAGIREELRRFEPDVVHISWSFCLLDGAIARAAHQRGARCVATFHLPTAPAGTARSRVLRALYRYHGLQMRHVDLCIALSDEQRDWLARAGYPRSRIRVIPNGVDTDAFSPGPSAWREQLGARVVALYIGRLDPEKRVPALVEAFLSLGLPDDHVLCLAGEGAQLKRLQRMSAGHPSIRVLGLVSGARRLDVLRGCDLFVLPSTAEGLALSMLEAMACGRAVVATDAGEDGRALGDAGTVIPTHPLRPALDQALRRVIDDAGLRARLGAAARARVLDRFTIRDNAARVMEVYLGGGAPTTLP